MNVFIATLLLAAVAAASAPSAAFAAAPAIATAAPENRNFPLLHTRWLARDGAPRNIEAIAQTPDGWLWLGSTDGLYRFDGARFTRYQPPPGVRMSTNIHDLGTLPDGSLWLSPFFGGLYLIKGERIRIFAPGAGFPPGAPNGLTATADGRLWLAVDSGLFVLAPGTRDWRLVNEEMGLSEGASDLLLGRDGTLWVQTSTGNYAMRPGEARFRLVAPTSPGSLVEGPDGAVWAIDATRRGLARLDGGATPPELDAAFRRMPLTAGFHVDKHGGFWFGGEPGVVRIALREGRVETHPFTSRQGLSGNEPIAAFTDREGNVWISTESGLDQFRPSRMREIVLPDSMADARPLAAGPGGELWIDTSFLRDVHDTPRDYGPARTRDTIVHQLHRDRHGDILFGTYSRLWKLDGFARIPVPLPPEVEALTLQPIYAIARDHEDGLWVSIGRRGAWRMKDGAWVRHGGVAGLKDFQTTAIVAGPDRRLWFGSVNNALAVLRDGAARRFGAAEGIDIGAVLSILPDAGGAWLGGDEGLARFDGRRALRIQGEDGEQFQGGTGLVREPGGRLWINGARGLAAIEDGELRKALADPAYRVRYRRYDEHDGLRGAPGVLYPSPSMVRTPDGHLVISTTGGVFHLDPARLVSNRTAPPVLVTGLSDGARRYPLSAPVSLPAAPESVRIDYTALSLALPQRVRFQYRLEGVDSGWQDAGNRRAAFYTRLGPGDYRFRVRAANEDGVWNEEGAQLRFTIAPTVFQRWWFQLACALALVLLVYALHRLRLRIALRRLGRSFEARVAERERIARDLHDTLLQSVQGLILHFRRIALRTPDNAPTRPLMQEALALATEVLEEGRDKLGGLRTAVDSADLAGLLETHGRRLSAQHGAAFALRQDGRVRRLRAPVLDELLAIAREAVRNAFLHAQAGRIEVALHYGERELALEVRDDGVGIEAAAQDGRAGHWGIPGMRERAAELGATIELRSAPARGCAWQLRLPARLAYEDENGPSDAGAAPQRQGALQ